MSVDGPTSRSDDRRAIAYHEAGHVVIGTLLGLDLLSSDLDRDGQGGRGHTHFAQPGPWFRADSGPLSDREREFVERVVTTFMAGFAAEERAGSADPDGSGWDLDLAVREWIAYLRPDGSRAQAADIFYERARAMLEAPTAWAAVERVAAALLDAGRVDGPRARSLVSGA
jgi:hypothetical protein